MERMVCFPKESEGTIVAADSTQNLRSGCDRTDRLHETKLVAWYQSLHAFKHITEKGNVRSFEVFGDPNFHKALNASMASCGVIAVSLSTCFMLRLMVCASV